MFNADDIERLDYDFSGFYDGGPKGVVPEPSTEAISSYQLALSNLLDTSRQRIEDVTRTSEVDEQAYSDEEQNKLIDEINVQTWNERKRLLAELCQGSPSYEDINRLGHRVFQKFEDYCLGRWTPQAASAASS